MHVNRVGTEKNSMLIYVTGFCGANKLFWKEQISGTERLRAILRAPLSGSSVPPNSARIGYATEGALFSAQLSPDVVSALRKVWLWIG